MLERGKESVFNIGSIILLVICFVFTYILEAGFAFITGKGSKRAMAIISLANIITNPAANLFYWIAGSYFNKIILVLLIEIAVVILEWGCYISFKSEFIYPARFSLGANTFSYFIGSIILLFIKGDLKWG